MEHWTVRLTRAHKHDTPPLSAEVLGGCWRREVCARTDIDHAWGHSHTARCLRTTDSHTLPAAHKAGRCRAGRVRGRRGHGRRGMMSTLRRSDSTPTAAAAASLHRHWSPPEPVVSRGQPASHRAGGMRSYKNASLCGCLLRLIGTMVCHGARRTRAGCSPRAGALVFSNSRWLRSSSPQSFLKGCN